MVYISVLVVLLSTFYLSYALTRYQNMAESETLQLAHTIEALLHMEHLNGLVSDDKTIETVDLGLVEESLAGVVKENDSIYYAYVLKKQDGDIFVIADSSNKDTADFKLMKNSFEEAVEANQIPFETGEGVVTKPMSTSNGKWIRVLVPIFDTDSKDVIATLGLTYSAAEWHAGLWNKMDFDIIIVICFLILTCTLAVLRYKNLKLKESERSKSVFYSQMPGMVYRCKNNANWTIEFVSEGSYVLTGYYGDELILDDRISYYDLIAPEYRVAVSDEWESVLMQHKRYHGEYEIIKKNGERRWVLELGQGKYDADGRVVALEGMVLDISDEKEKEQQIAYLKERDLLTGLFNGNYLEKEKKHLDQPKFWPLSIAICDIDGLRMVNDAYGYEEGNRLIIKTAKMIQECLCGEYVLGHTGGGEFVLLLPQKNSQEVHQLKLDIKDAIADYNRGNKNALYTMSVSIGHSTKDAKGQEIQDVFRDAVVYLNNRKLLNQNSTHSDIISAIMATLYAKSQETEEHGQRLGGICQTIGEQLGLEPKVLDDLQLLSKLHDIGKIGIDNHVLNKPGKLNEEEWKIMKQHPQIGYNIAMSTPQLEHIAVYILYHHERWDGTGYPLGLKGNDIPIVSRILSIADAFDAMTEDRVYRKSMSLKETIEELERNAGTQFDPQIIKVFVETIYD